MRRHVLDLEEKAARAAEMASGRSMWPRALLVAALAGLLLCFASVAIAKPHRSPAARAEFMRTYPCPATGKTRGACPGWQVDHITPLKCGGPDDPRNMQWLTVQAHKEKTAREAKSCRKPVGG